MINQDHREQCRYEWEVQSRPTSQIIRKRKTEDVQRALLAEGATGWSGYFFEREGWPDIIFEDCDETELSSEPINKHISISN